MVKAKCEKYDRCYELNIHLAYSSYGKSVTRKASFESIGNANEYINVICRNMIVLGNSPVDQEIVIMEIPSQLSICITSGRTRI